jgi:hypothetical protein
LRASISRNGLSCADFWDANFSFTRLVMSLMKKLLSTTFAGLAFSSMAVALSAPCAYAQATTDAPGRLVVVKTAKPPAIDGILTQTDWLKPEWGEFAAVTGFTDLGTKKYATRQSKAYITYDDERLYVAFWSDRAAGTTPLSTVTQRDGAVWGDDAVEFHIAPPGQEGKEKPLAFQLIGNSAGAFYDSKSGDKSWNGAWQYAAKVSNQFWVAEASIRWADLGISAPKDGEVWRMNICRAWQDPAANTNWGHSNNFLQVDQFAYVTMRDRGTVARVETLGKFTSGIANFGVELVNTAGTAPDDIIGTLTLGTVKSEAQATVAPNGTAKLDFLAKIVDKNTDNIGLRIESKTTGQVLWENALNFERTNPVSVALSPLPSKNIVEMKIDIAGMPERPSHPTATLIIDGGQPGAKNTVITGAAFDDKGLSFTTIPLTNFHYGNHEVTVRVNNGENTISESKLRFNRVEETWLNNKIGVTEKLLSNLTPIEVNAKTRTLKCWDRTITFDGTLFPSQIVARKASLLAAPTRLEGQIGGKPILWKNVTFKVTKQTPARVDFVITATSDQLQVTNEAYLEYDGMFFFKLHFKPIGPKVTLDSLKFVMPMAQGRALYWNQPLVSSAPHVGNVPQGEAWKSSFMNFMWVGDRDRGLSWFAEDNAQWKIADTNKTLELLPAGNKGTDWGINLADSALEINGTHTIAFGLQPTPVKPMPKGGRLYNVSSLQGVSPSVLWSDPQTTKYFGYPEAVDAPYIKARTDDYRAHGAKLVPYMCAMRIGEMSPEWQFYGRDWAMPGVLNNYDADVLEFSGGQMGFCPSIAKARDWMTAKNKEYLDATGYNGLYYDFSWAYPCFNSTHDHPAGAYPLLGYRELFKRLYTLNKLRDPDNLILAHISGGILPMFLSWSDATVPGEEIVGKMMTAREQEATKDTTDLADIIDLDYYMNWCMGRQYGIVPVYMPPVWAEPKHHNAFMLLTDSIGAWRNDPPLVQVWQDLGMGEDDVQFLPFWENGEYIKANFTDAPEGVKGDKYPNPLVSAYRRPNNFVLFAVTNLTKIPRKVKVQFDPKTMKLDLKQYGLTDAYQQSALAPTNGTFEAEVPARSYRLILMKRIAPGDTKRAAVAEVPAVAVKSFAGPGRIRGGEKEFLWVGDAIRDPHLVQTAAPVKAEPAKGAAKAVGKGTALPQSRVAQTFTLTAPVRVRDVYIETLEKKALRSGLFCDLRIYKANADGTPSATLADPKAYTWTYSYPLPGETDFRAFPFKQSFVLQPGRYVMVLSKAPGVPEDRHLFTFPLWTAEHLPGETAFSWNSVTQKWSKADGVLSFEVKGYER